MKCIVKFVDVNRYTVHVELVTPATFSFDIEIPTSWIFIQIREKVLKVPEILVRYCTNVTTTVTRPTPGREGDLNVADILTELQRVPSIREGPRVHQLAMMAMVYCLCCLNIKGTTNTVRQLVFNVQE